ncbi:MAG: ParA family protein [Leptospiraceae bacterium]|nr:ParA family protein [Leptospiraceae bacterium]MDW7976225.1 ParA family protein [Leptospiraceae bacterium]
MSIAISIINYKGGVGKTTLTLNLSYALSSIFQKSVLMIDLDPQCSLSISAVKDTEWVEHIENKGSIISVIEAFYKGKLSFDPDWLISIKQSKKTYLLPGHLNLPEYEMKLVYQKPLYMSIEEFESQRFFILQKYLKSLKDEFDFIFFDCPPNVYVLSRNAILASDFYVIPTIPDFVSSFGIPFIHKHIEELIHSWYGKTKFLGIILNKVRTQRQNLIKEFQIEYEKISEKFPNKVFETFISDRILISSIMRRKINIFNESSKKYQPLQQEFRAFAEEIMRRIEANQKK